MVQKLNRTETDFLKSLSTSELQRVLGQMPKDEATVILRQLTGDFRTEEINGDRERRLRYDRKARLAVQDIAPLPANPEGKVLELRQACDASLRKHLTTCYPNAFSMEFSPDHERLIEQIEVACDVGQLKALAMPRGSGKTTILVRAALWSILTGRRRFCVIVAATEVFAVNLLRSVKTEILTNGMLATLYGREIHALRSLEDEAKRSLGQRFRGNKTHVQWLQRQINFGHIEDVQTSGAILSCCGITGNIRGQQVTGVDGRIRRPDLVLCDDPQTKESAASPAQCQKLHETMMGDMLGMAGPETSIAALTTCTVIYKNDLADRLLDRKLSPVWQGEKCSMIYRWSQDRDIWDKYRTVWEEELADNGDGSIAAQFVRDHYDQMHEGSVVGWDKRFAPHEVSALQHAWNLRFRDETTFWAEYQNDPKSAAEETPFEINPDEVARRTNNVPRLRVPDGCEKITTFVDVQNKMLYFVTAAWEMNGRGHVINYGAFPDQRRVYFTKRDAERTLQNTFGTEDLNEALYVGLESLCRQLFERFYVREDGSEMSLDRVGIDARSGSHTEVVRRFCRESKYVGRVHPQFGQFIGANSRLWQHTAHDKKRDAMGWHCKFRKPSKYDRGVRELWVDVNYWKSYTAEKLINHKGGDNSILLYRAEPHEHRMFAEHMACEEPVVVTGKIGNSVVEWRQPNGIIDNDLWDCLVGNSVLSHIEGVKVHADKKQKPTRRKSKRPRQFVEL